MSLEPTPQSLAKMTSASLSIILFTVSALAQNSSWVDANGNTHSNNASAQNAAAAATPADSYTGADGLVHRRLNASGEPAATPVARKNLSRGMGIRWKTFNDPNQNAFSIDVPADWTVEGGSFPLTVSDVRSYIRVVSPDGGIEIFVGDRNVGPFMTMNRGLEIACRSGRRQMCQGGTYPMPDGTQVSIQPYATGGQFAAIWGAMRIGQSCSSPQINGRQELAQASQNISSAAGSMTVSDRAGDAHFQCTHGGAPGAGYVFAATELGHLQSGEEMWQVKVLSGFIANQDRELEAWHLLPIIAGSLRINQQWLAQHNAAANAAASSFAASMAAAAAANARMNNAASQSMSATMYNNDAFKRQMDAYDRTNDNFARIQRGQALYNDPDRGAVNMENYPHQWKLPDGSHIGTDFSTPPVPNAIEMPVIDTSTPH